MTTPYEYHNNKLGVKVSYLISDRNLHTESLRLITYRALKKRMDSAAGTEQQLRRGALNSDSLVLFSSLTQEWRDCITVRFGSPKEEIKRSWFAEHYEADRKAFDFFNAYRFGDDNKKLDPALIEKYTYNASVLNTVLKIKANRKAYARALGCTKIDIWESLSKDVNAFRDVDHNLPTTSRGLRMKINDYLKYSYVSVVSGRLQNQNATKVKDNEQNALIEELLAKHTNLDNTQVANLYNTVAELLGWKSITPQTVANIKEERNLVVYAGRKGTMKLLDNKLMQNKRKAPSNPMLYWTMDGWDAELLYQKPTINSKGQTVITYHNRLNIVTIIDPFNKYVVGYAIGTHETPDLIKEALRNAMHHVKELFGSFYRPYQLQTDRYQIKALTPTYQACSTHYTPANAKSKKAKVIEPWFNYFNKKYCQLFDNWSGHNVDSGSDNQPNEEVLNKIRHTFPDERGCRQQLINSIEEDRRKNQAKYIEHWQNVGEELRSEMTAEMYLQYLGLTTGFTNKLQGAGLLPTINGVERCYDSFDINFRKLAHLDWVVKYDPSDLTQVLVLNAEKKGNKINEIGSYQFILSEKYIQPMALADRSENDALELQKVRGFNTDVMQFITDQRHDNATILDSMFRRPELDNTLAKLLIVDSKGSHKDHKSNHRLNERAKEILETSELKIQKQDESTLASTINEYHKQKINLNDFR